MYIFDVSGDELFSDTYKVSLVDNVLYEVIGKVSFENVKKLHYKVAFYAFLVAFHVSS